MIRRTGLAALLLALVVPPACGDDETETTPPGNDPPSWTDAPAAAVPIGQGKTLLLPITIEDDPGDELYVTLGTLPAGIEASILQNGDEYQLSIRAGYTVSGQKNFGVVLDDRIDANDVTVIVDVLPLRWVGHEEWEEPDGPEAREHGSVIVDEDGGQAFVFGGTGYSPYLEPFNDAWRYDIASGAWSQATVTGDVPEPGGSRRVAHVPGTNTAYLFGGYGGVDGGVYFNDLYRVTVEGDELAFELITQENEPSVRFLHGFAYDPGSDRFVAFGGAGTGLNDDTHTMTVDGNTATWTELSLDTGPSARYGFFTGVDAVRGRMIVFSGQVTQTTFADDTWALDMRAEPPAWQLLLEGGGAGEPPGRRNGCAVYDSTAERLFVFGGTSDGITTEPGLFVFDARPDKQAWSLLALDGEPDPRSSGFGFHDSAGDRTLLGFGNDDAVYQDWGIIGY